MTAESTYVERAPAPALAAIAASVWVQRVGDRPMAQRHEPHGGFEVRCVLGEAPRLLGPLTTATFRDVPAGGTVVGVRLRPGVLGGLVGMPADELVDEDVAGPDLWCTAACAAHDHAASYLPMLRGDGRFVQEHRPVPA